VDPAGEVGERIADWYAAAHRDLPWRRDGFGAWGILVSEFMLQQTPVARVIPRLAAWLERWPAPAALAAVPSGEAVRAWDRLGYPRRALALHGAAVAITERHGGVVPADVDALLALPGVGPYTARAVAAFAYGMRVPVVDVNTRRVLARAVTGDGDAGPANARRDHALMESVLPADPDRARLVNAGAMELGQTVCIPRTPHCERCPLATVCAWWLAGSPAYDGPLAPRQKRYEGSDRQVRGRILHELRGSDIPVPADVVSALWPDAVQRERALTSLLGDGLVVLVEGRGDEQNGYTLPE
jgi:A/G-specific adenine glycosylase